MKNLTVHLLIVVINLLADLPFAMADLNDDNHMWAAQLLRDLTGTRYNRSVLPAGHCKDKSVQKRCVFEIQARMFLLRIQDVTESQETLTTTLRFQLGWIDPELKWNPADYGGIDSITIPGNLLWKPDLQLANSVDNMYTLLNSNDFGFRVTNDGQVWRHPTGKVSTRCRVDLTYYPFDTQVCPVIIESVIYTTEELRLIVRPDKPDPVALNMFTPNQMWQLKSSTGHSMMYNSSRFTAFGRVHFWLMLERNSNYYQQTFLVPVALLSILQILTYFMPVHFGGRVGQSTVVLLSAFFLEGYIADRLPKSGTSSLVQTYLNIIIGVSVASIAICILTTEIIDPDEGLEYWGIKRLITAIKAHKNHGRVGISKPKSAIVKVIEANSDGISGAKLGTAKNKDSNGKDGDYPLEHKIMAAAFVNLAGFIICVLLAVIYPCIAFLAYVAEESPTLPVAPDDHISVSYYAEY